MKLGAKDLEVIVARRMNERDTAVGLTDDECILRIEVTEHMPVDRDLGPGDTGGQ
jgi:hypothetical protein